MTKATVLLGASALLLATAAVAQPALPPPGDPRGGPAAGPPPPPPPGGPRRGPDGPPPRPKGAHFRFERGDMRIDVRCADDEPMRSCADITLQMFDKLSAMKPADGR